MTAGSGEAAATATTDMAGMDMSGSTGDTMTEADYQQMSDAMDETISQFPAETAGLGNEELEPTILPDGTKHFELTAAITEWEVASRSGRPGVDLQRHGPRAADARRGR